ncbi:MAG: RNA polymerase sigma factor [Phycisphaerales bacterium]
MTPTTQTISEAELVARLKAGDAAAYERLVREHTPHLLAVALRYLPNEHDARDAVQDAFLSAFKAIHSFQEHARLSTWLHRIAVNAALMRRRAMRRRPARSLDELLPAFDHTGHHARAPAPWRSAPDAEEERAELTALLRECLDELPDEHREVLALRDIEDLDTASTARVLGISEPAVRTRLHRARLALRTLLDPHLRA